MIGEKSKNVRRVLAILVGIMMIFACTGCGETEGGEDPYAEKTDAASLAKYFYDNITFEEEMTNVDKDTALELYDLEPEVVLDASVYVSSNCTDEIAVFTVDGDENALVVASSIGIRIGNQKSETEKYSADELAKLDNAVITQLDNAVVVIVCENTDEADTAIASYIAAYLDEDGDDDEE